MLEHAGLEPATSYLQRTTRSNAVLPEPIRQRCANNYGVHENRTKTTNCWIYTMVGTCSGNGSRLFHPNNRCFEIKLNSAQNKLQLLIRLSVPVPVVQFQLENPRIDQRIELLSTANLANYSPTGSRI